jgi:hypothetical protein
MAENRTWKVVDEEGSTVTYKAGTSADEELLAELLTRWSRDLAVADWGDRQLFAGICYRESNLTVREAAGMVGLTPEDVEDVTVPDGPPWELAHPEEERRISIEREQGSPDSDTW